MFSGNKEEGAFCFFIFWTKVSGEDLQSTLTVQLIHRSGTRGNKEQVVQENRKYSKAADKEEKSRKYR